MSRIGAPSVQNASYTGSAPRTASRGKALAWALRPRNATFLVTGLLVVAATGVIAGILLRQDVGVTNASQDSDIQFLDGGGGVLGFATVTVDSSGASADISLSGVAGAALMQVTGLLQIQNTDVTQDYSITLKRGSVPDSAITGLTFTVLDGVTVMDAYDAAAGASGSAFTLPASDTFDIRIDMIVADGTAVGSLGNMDLQFEIVAV